jgi:hypothetical protein
MDGLLIFGKEEPMEKGEFILGMVAYILVTSKMGGEGFYADANWLRYRMVHANTASALYIMKSLIQY